MQISKVERFLMTNVGYIFHRYISKIYTPPLDLYKETIISIQAMYYDTDMWETEDDDYEDTQLFMLGLDVEKINDKDAYWNYDTRTGRDSGRGRGGRSSGSAPEWI